MSPTKTAPYGSWKSPITSDLIVAQSISLSEVRLDGGNIYWLEGRPQEQGRNVVVRGDEDGQRTDITPPPYNARTRVHEYGGGAWTVVDGTVYFSNFADGRLYRQAARRIRAAGADPRAARARARLAVRRRRDRPSPQPLDRRARGSHGRWRARQHHRRCRARRCGCRARPRSAERARFLLLRRGCRRTAGGSLWLAWDHPNMPWNGTMLYLAEVAEDGAVGEAHLIAGGTGGIDLPAGVVARRRSRSCSCPIAPAGGISIASSLRRARRGRWRRWRRSSGCRNGQLGASTYAFAGRRSHRLRLFRGRARPTCGAGPRSRNADADRHAIHRIRLGAGRRRPRGVSRRRPRSSRQHRRARSRFRPTLRPEKGNRHSRSCGAAHRGLPRQGRERGIPDHRRRNRLRPVLSAPQSRLCARRAERSRRSWSSATAGRPRRRRARSIWGFNTGRAAASRCWT